MVVLMKKNHTCACGRICYATILGRKRILPRTPEKSPLKKNRCSSSNGTIQKPPNWTPPQTGTSGQIDRLPEDLLVRIISRTDHGDLKHLLLVSRAIRDAAIISKQSHFDFKTPLPKSRSRGGNHPRSEDGHDLADDCDHHDDEDDDPEAPMAPRRASRARATCKDLAAITIALFTDPQDH